MAAGRVVGVTGANGYIGSHIVKVLLERGHNVRAGARLPHNDERVGHLQAMKSGKRGTLEIHPTDILVYDDVESLLDGCTDVIHTAATVKIKSSSPQESIIDPSLEGTRNVIRSVRQNNSIRNVIHTSSTAAIRPMKWKNGITLASDSWANDATIENNPYGLAKVLAEREIRSWHTEEGSPRGVRLVTIHPCMVFGPPLSSYHLRGSLTILMMLADRSMPAIIPMNINIVDVRDVAEAHVRALDIGADGGRYLVTAGSLWMREVVSLLRTAYPNHKWPKFSIPYPIALVAAALHPSASISWARTHLGTVLNWDSRPASEDLAIDWLDPSKSVVDTFNPIFDKKWI